MSTTPMTDSSRQRIYRACELALDAVESGSTPTQAAVKAARATNLPGGHVHLLCNAMNAALVEGHRNDAPTLAEKSATISLVSPEQVQAEIGKVPVAAPQQKKQANIVFDGTAYPRSYRGGQKFQKAARDLCDALDTPAKPVEKVAPPADFLKRKRIAEKSARQSKIEAREAMVKQNEFQAVTRDIRNYFRKRASLPLPLVVKTAAVVYGPSSTAIIAFACENLPRALLAKEATTYAFDDKVEPYSLIKKACELAKQAKQASQNADQLAMIARALNDPDYRDQQPTELEQTLLKYASMTGSMLGAGWGALGAGALGKALGNKPEGMPTESDIPDIQQMDDMRRVKITAMLSDLLANDEVISKFDPGETLHHFNEISTAAPNAAMNMNVLRPILRKRLEGGKNAIDVYDTGLLLDLEQKLRPQPLLTLGKD